MPVTPPAADAGGAATTTRSVTASTDRRIAIVVTLAWLALVGSVTVWWHEPWRDEWQAWMLARDSDSLAALARNARYEGHPLLWHIVLYVAARVRRDASTLVAVHLAIATAVTWIVVRHAPFPRSRRIALVFGYFLAFEYAVIARGYALGVLSLVTVLTLACGRGSDARTLTRAHVGRLAVLSLALAALANTTAHGLVMAALLTTVLAYDAWRAPAAGVARLPWLGGAAPHVRRGAAATLVAIPAAAGLVSASRIVPPADASFTATTSARPTTKAASWVEGAITVQRAYLPIADPRTVRRWGSNLAENLARETALPRRVPALLLLTLTGALLLFADRDLARARAPVARVLFVAGTAAYIAVTAVVFPGSLRHHGHLFLVLVAAWWLAGGTVRDPQATRAPDPVDGRVSPFSRVRDLILAGQLLGALLLLLSDLTMPFSGAREAARLLVGHGLASAPMFGARREMVSSIAGHLDRPIHVVEEGRAVTFASWGDRRARTHPEAIAMQVAERRAPVALALAHAHLDATGQRRLVLVLDTPIPSGMVHPVHDLQPLGSSRGLLAHDESYWLYLLCAARCPPPSTIPPRP